jgi:hypothetical protein
MFAIWTITQLLACKACQEQKIAPVDTGEVVPFSNHWGKWLDMKSDSAGNPVVSYYDLTHGALGLATGEVANEEVDGSAISWTHEEVDGYPNVQGLDEGDRGSYSSLAITSTDKIWLAYYDTSLKTLRYATRENGSSDWTIGIADTGGGGTPDAGKFASIALDANEYPVISHYDVFRGTLRVTHFNGTSFTGEIVDEGTDYDNGVEVVGKDVGKFTSLQIVNGVEYIAYYDVAAGDLKLAHGTTGSYSVETVDADGDVGQWTSLQVVDGTIYITYQDITNDQLKIAYGTAGNWNYQVIDQGAAIGADSELLSTSNGLVVVYHDGYNNDIKLARRNGTNWSVSTLGGTDMALGFHNELIEINGNLFAGCFDFTNQSVWFSAILNE